MKKLLVFSAMIIAAVVFNSCQKDVIPEKEDLTLKSAELVVDADWLSLIGVRKAIYLGDGLWEFHIGWRIKNTSDADLMECVKTQGGLTATVILEDGEEEPGMVSLEVWKKTKKNFVLYGEACDLEAFGEDGRGQNALYKVVFRKEIDALPGEEVELTGDWTSKWVEEDVPVDPDGIPDSGDEYLVDIEHQVGYEPPVMWTVPTE